MSQSRQHFHFLRKAKPSRLGLTFILWAFVCFLALQILFFALNSLEIFSGYPVLKPLFLAFLLSLIAFVIFKMLVLKPIFQLEKMLRIFEKKKKRLSMTKYEKRPDEVGKIFKYLNQWMTQLDSQKKIIHSYELINNLGTEERNEFISQISHYNMKTGLPNNKMLQELLKDMLVIAKPHKDSLAVSLLELCDLHEIISIFGEELGDIFLKRMVELLKNNMPADTLLAHITNSRFVIVRKIDTPTQTNQMMDWIVDLFSRPFHIREEIILCTVNLGVAIAPKDGQDPESLVANAHLALNKAKADAPNSYQFYDEGLNAAVEDKRNLLVDLHYAIEQNQFELYYQPQISLKSGKLIGVEALLRWPHKEKGMISPADFLPVAEESGVITQIGEWVLHTATKQVKAWRDQGFPLTVAVNLSTLQFKQKNIVDVVSRILRETDLEPEFLELEITESGIMHHPSEAILLMKAFRRLGVQLALDDFGTGYSSLSYLSRFPVQKLKIDQSFVKHLGSETKGRTLADIIILLGQVLNLKVIAEGVETEAQLNFLKERGCDEVQGYFYGKPTCAEDCPQLFERLL